MIVVGNISVGGSGKTPLVLWIAELLRSRGHAPAIISRGYGGRVEAPQEVNIASDPRDVGDEPVLLARHSGCPVWVSPDRVAAAQAACTQHPECDVLVLDDGLQHYRLRRDIELAIVDSRGFGNGWLLPAGPLREPPRRLERVDAVISHEASVPGYAMRLRGETVTQLVDARMQRALASFSGQRVHAVAGIGDPSRFFASLERHGLRVTEHPFPDHHLFTAPDLEFGDELPVLMTEKDAVKLRGVARANWWVLPVRAELDPAFGDWLLGKLAAVRTRRSKQ